VPTLRGRRVLLRPVEHADAAELRRIHETHEVSAWWGHAAEDFPLEDDPATAVLTILENGHEVAGLIQFTEELEPDYKFASIDLFLDPARHRRGLATDALETVIEHLRSERGHHRITIDPAADNHAAVACYEKAGFRTVGVTRSSWRDPSGSWRDGLLMELVFEPPPPLESAP
jgi:aminoglycoside 6'-N-acetyltransferase